MSRELRKRCSQCRTHVGARRDARGCGVWAIELVVETSSVRGLTRGTHGGVRDMRTRVCVRALHGPSLHRRVGHAHLTAVTNAPHSPSISGLCTAAKLKDVGSASGATESRRTDNDRARSLVVAEEQKFLELTFARRGRLARSGGFLAPTDRAPSDEANRSAASLERSELRRVSSALHSIAIEECVFEAVNRECEHERLATERAEPEPWWLPSRSLRWSCRDTE